MRKLLCLLALLPTLLLAQTKIDLYRQSKQVTKGTTPPATCTIGDLFFDTDATAGQNWFGCTATNVWTSQGSLLWSNGVGGAIYYTGGNVLVGTGTDDGSGAKLQVSGAASLKTNNPYIKFTNTSSANNYVGYLQHAGAGGDIFELNAYGVGNRLNLTANNGPITLIPGTGVVMVGTNTDNGSGKKFQVTGGISLTNDCLRFPDGSCQSTATVGGSGSFQSLITDLAPTRSTVTVTNDRLNIAAGWCWGVTKTAATATITAGTGSGSYVAYCTDTQTLVVEHSTAAGLTVSCSGCTQMQVTTPTVPEGMTAIASGSLASGGFSSLVDLRDWTKGLRIQGNGVGMNTQCAGGTCLEQVDTATVQLRSANYTPTAQFDASASTLFRQRELSADPGTCTKGEYYWNTSSAKGRRCTATNTWADDATSTGSAPDTITTLTGVEDFAGGNSTATQNFAQYEWSSNTANGGTLSYLNGEANHPGIVRLSTSTTANGSITMTNGNTVLTGGAFLLSDTVKLTFLFRLNANDSNTDVRAGFICAAAAYPPTDFIGVEKKAADTNYFLNNRASSADSRTDTTVAVPAANTWTAVQLRRVSGTQWGVRIATGSSALTNVSAASETVATVNPTCAASIFTQITNNGSTADKRMDVDYIRWDVTGMTR